MLREMNTTDSSLPIGIRLGATLAVSLAAVSLAAGCGSSKSSGTKAAAGSTTTSAGAASSTSASGTVAASDSSGGVNGGASPGTPGSSTSSLPPKPTTPGPGGPHDCSTDMLSFKIDPVREPINHVLISATNTSKLPCHLNKFPSLRTFQSQTIIIRAAAATKPSGTVLLAPGATAYAGVMTNSADGSGTNGRQVPSLSLDLQSSGADGGGVGRPVTVQMPASAQYVDSSAVVTYWQSDMQSALY